jgi:acyl carrier protein
MDSRADVAAKVRNILREQLDAPWDRDITDGARLDDDLGADSLDSVEIAMALEDEFAIEIPDDELKMSMTFAEVVTLIERKKGG